MEFLNRHGFPMEYVTRMAYLRKETETVEIAYPLNKVWMAIQKVLAGPEWKIEQVDEKAHHAEARTKAEFMSYSSLLLIDAFPVDENATRLSIVAHTPVTTITAMLDFGQARRRINLFFLELKKQLDSQSVGT
jgi:hypothetical protein